MVELVAVPRGRREERIIALHEDLERNGDVVKRPASPHAILGAAGAASVAACRLILLRTAGKDVASGTATLDDIARAAVEALRRAGSREIRIARALRALARLATEAERSVPAQRHVDLARGHLKAVERWFDANGTRVERADRRPSARRAALRFAEIRVAEGCLWWTSHRRHKLLRHRDVEIGFHEIGANVIEGAKIAAGKLGRDLVLDIVVRNTTDEPRVVEAIGLRPLDLWTDLKGLSTARRIRKQGTYRFRVKDLATGQEQWWSLPEFVDVPPAAGRPWRFELQLQRLADAMKGNEMIAELLLRSERRVFASPPIYFGTYGAKALLLEADAPEQERKGGGLPETCSVPSDLDELTEAGGRTVLDFDV